MIKNVYSFWQILDMAYSLLKTKMINVHIRFIRFPIDLRGRKHIYFGESLTVGRYCRFETFSTDNKKKIIFGKNVHINDFVHICAMGKVLINDNVLMASHIYISDNSHGFYKGNIFDTSPLIPPIKRSYFISPVTIEKNVWIGEGCVILPGVTIGMGSIIGANSVVSKDIPSNVIAVGCPAVPIKKYNLLTNKWERI